MTNCFFCRKQFKSLDESHLHALGLKRDGTPSCSKMSIQTIVELDRNDRWFA